MKFNKLAMIGTAVLAMTSLPAHALDTLIQYSTDGSGTGSDGSYDVTGVNEFDWQSSGDLVIVNQLPFSQACGAGTCSTFEDWADNAVDGQTVVFDSYVHARLNDMLDNNGDSVAPTSLSTDGGVTNIGGDACGGSNCFEVTAAANIRETAVLSGLGTTLVFLTATGSYEFLHDASPDSDVASGAGFVDGDTIISGDVGCSGAACGSFIAGIGGSTFFANDVDAYDTDYIQTDPDSNAPLSETTFDTLISLISSGEASVAIPGGTIGLAEYLTQVGDIGFKADANSEFSANPEIIPEPSTLALLGLGLFGMAGLRKRRNG